MKNLLVNSEKQSRFFFFKWMQYASVSYIVNLQWRASSFCCCCCCCFYIG